MSATGGGDGQGEEKKPGDQSAHINLKVKGQVYILCYMFTMFCTFMFFYKFFGDCYVFLRDWFWLGLNGIWVSALVPVWLLRKFGKVGVALRVIFCYCST